jgi:hypothetical protein
MPTAHINMDALARACWTDAPVIVSYDSSVASAQLTAGKFYYVIATTTCHFLQGASSVAATTSSNYLPAGMMVKIKVTDATTNGYVAFIKATGSSAGSAYLMAPSTP